MNSDNSDKTKYIVILMYSIIIVGIIMYITTKYYEKTTRCSSIKKNYEDDPISLSRTEPENDDYLPKLLELKCKPPQTINIDKWESNNKCNSTSPAPSDNIASVEYFPSCLLNYRIKTAYNCCAVNTFKNSWVGDCALSQCIKAGARCLDFEIYSIDNNPVIGFSSRENNLNIKESFNKIDLHKAMTIINNTAFGEELTNDTNFPILLNFRLKTKNVKVYDKIAKILYQSFGDKLLDPKYSYNNDKNRKVMHDSDNKWVHKMEGITDRESGIPLICRNLNSKSALDSNANMDFNDKVIVIINVSSILPGKTGKDNAAGIEFEQMCKHGGREGILLDYMNLVSPGPFCMHLRDFEVENASDTLRAEYKSDSRSKLIFTTPTVGNSSRNVNWTLHTEIGAQIVGMCFQNYIKNRPASLSQITKYHNYFTKHGVYARKDYENSFSYKIKANPEATPESTITAPSSTH